MTLAQIGPILVIWTIWAFQYSNVYYNKAINYCVVL